jgi:pyruvate formate lyase activating enzyme
MRDELPTFFDIKRYALHDGPNIRTTVFFKGCPLHCAWCHNPEGIGSTIEIVTVQERCIGCRECLEGCPEKALSFSDGLIERDSSRCTLCLNCVEICPSLAHEAVGWQGAVETIITEIEKDLPFYDQSGGGVTFSGGEPLYQSGHLISLLKRCGELEIHRSVDTSGYAETAALLAVAEHTDLFLYDLKLMDSEQHKKYTGVANDLILRNLQALDEAGASVRVRLPLIGTINDSEENIEAMGRFLSGLAHINDVDILVYHDLAGPKYQKLSQTRMSGAGCRIAPGTVDRTRAILEGYGLSVHREH